MYGLSLVTMQLKPKLLEITDITDRIIARCCYIQLYSSYISNKSSRIQNVISFATKFVSVCVLNYIYILNVTYKLNFQLEDGISPITIIINVGIAN